MPAGLIASSSTQVDPERPWLGLRSFDENASAYFFGRDAELRDIFERVQHRPLTVLFGQSGLGKTSLLRAGLVPRLRDAGFLPVVLRLEYEEGDSSPADQLREALIQAARDAGVTLPRELPTDLWLLLHDPHCGFCADPSAASSATLPRPVLILDQFEEIFTLGERKPNAAEDLCAALAVLAENRAPADLDARLAEDDDLALRLRHDARPARVILSLREDFLHMLERWKRAVPAVMENRLELRLLTGPQALLAAVEPGKRRCRDSSLPPIVSDATGAAIVRFVAGVTPEVPLDEIDAVPPLLSLLCAELNEQRVGLEDVIRPEQLHGRAEDILEKFYNRCFDAHPPAVRVFVEERLLSHEGFRESTAEDTARHELQRAGLSAADADTALKQLVDNRLLVVEERGGIRRVELTHDILTGIARRSRDLRREREATAARRRARSRLAVISTVIASLFACVSVLAALWTQWQNAKLKAMLEEAARSDRLVALDKIQSGEHADALAHLGRAHRYLPSSSLTAEIALPLILSSPLRGDLAVFRGHGGYVSSAQFSADGKRVLTASDKTARLWEAESGKLLASYEGHGGYVSSAQFSADGKRVLTASSDETARLWETESGKLLASYEGHGGSLSSAQFSADGKRVLTASDDKTARLWEAESGKLLASYEGHGGYVYSAHFSADGKRVLTASSDKTARLWEAESGKLLASYEGHGGYVYSAQFSADGKRVLTASSDETARLWEAESGKLLASYEGHGGYVYSAQFSADGKRVLTASDDKTARLWEAESGKLLASYEGHGGPVYSAQFNADGKRVLTASDDKTARLWEAESRKLLASCEGHGGPVYSAQFSADGKRVLTASDDKTARLWEAESGKLLASYEGHGGPVYSAQFSADGKRVLTASDDKTARLWEAESGKLLASYEGHGGPLSSAQFSADGKRVLTASYDKTARLWEAESGKLLASYEGHGGYVSSAQFSADGKRVLTTSSDKTARLWEAESGKLLASYEGHGGYVSSALSADGKRVLTASDDKTARLWEAESGKLLVSYEGHGGPVSSAQFSADGKRVLTASPDKTARLWEAESGKLLASYEGHGGPVSSAQFSPDGKRVLTASSDKTARLWEAESGKLLASYEGHGGPLYSAQFSADGKRVLTASDDKTARLWPLLPANIEVAEWFGDFLIFLGGQRIGEDGEMKILSNSERHAVESKLRQFARVKDDYSLLLRWQLTTTSDRTVDPYGTITQKQLASELISQGQGRDAMQRAYNLDPWNPVVHLALAEFEEDPETADWLRHYSLDRLPDDPILERQAADMLRKQQQPGLALEFIDRALKHTPQDPDALALRTAILKDLNR